MKNLNMISRRSFLKAALAASAVSAMALTGCATLAEATPALLDGQGGAPADAD